MRIFNLEITKRPKWFKQKDLFFECPKCGKLNKLRSLPSGETILSSLYDISEINSVELTCECGGVIHLISQNELGLQFGSVDLYNEMKKIEKKYNSEEI